MSELITTLRERAYRIRRYALRMGEVQGQGYIGQALGWADVLAVAYGHALAYRADDPHWEGRDRFLLSHGHYAIAFYAALLEAGIVPESELETYGSDDSRLPMSGMAGPLERRKAGVEEAVARAGRGVRPAVRSRTRARRRRSAGRPAARPGRARCDAVRRRGGRGRWCRRRSSPGRTAARTGRCPSRG